uniref:Uncharacterized protein n=1 Tax=Kuenenia stuttgartiensis TaxID=174633 RepID=Q1PWP1_KUEST|nr:unknown protein [Candidatus Kuenenia stuttgartiensis]
MRSNPKLANASPLLKCIVISIVTLWFFEKCITYKLRRSSLFVAKQNIITDRRDRFETCLCN